MPLVIPPGFAHIGLQFRHTEDPEPWYVTFGVDVTEAGGDPEAVAINVMASWNTNINPTQSNQVSVTGCEVVVGQDGPDPVRAFFTPATLMNGQETTEKLPQNCALLVRKNTSVGGRRARGRMFVPGCLNEAAVSATGLIQPSNVANFQTQFELFRIGLNNNASNPAFVNTPMVLLHSTGLSPVIEPTPVTSLSVDNVISTQRRRLR